MESCNNPEIGQMIALYEFDLLSPEEREEVEAHLLQCDVCYQELYEFSPVVETIKENIGKFQKAVAVKKSIFQLVSESLVSFMDIVEQYVWKPIFAAPRPLRLAIPAFAGVIAVVIMIRVIALDKQTGMLADTNVDRRNISQKQPQQYILQEPEVMEYKGQRAFQDSSDLNSVQIQDSGLINILNNSMQVEMSKDMEFLIFSWLKIDSVKYYHVYLIDGGEKITITPERFYGDHFKYPVKNVALDKPYVWELSGEMVDGKRFRVQKKVVY